jgi:DnaJ-class molecular chaperone
MSSGASDGGASTRAPQEPEDRSTCTPCRGTGRVRSALGGQSHEVTCPWCGGSGQFAPGRDAQAEPAETPDSVA